MRVVGVKRPAEATYTVELTESEVKLVAEAVGRQSAASLAASLCRPVQEVSPVLTDLYDGLAKLAGE